MSIEREMAGMAENSETGTGPRRRIGFLTNVFTPYKHAFLSRLNLCYDVIVYYTAEGERDVRWIRERDTVYTTRVLRTIDAARWIGTRRPFPYALGLRRTLAQDQLDILLVGGYDSPAFIQGALAARRMGIPAVLITGGWAGDKRTHDWMKRPIKRALCRLFDAAIAYTEHARAYAIKTLRFDKTRVWVGTATVDTEGLQTFGREFTQLQRARWRTDVLRDDADGRIMLLYAGRLVASKGVDTLLRAFARLPEQFSLVLAGSGEQEVSLRELARELGVEHRSHWLGFLNWEELAAAYHSADVFVLPSRSEPHGNVVNEAAACGLPVIVSDGVGTDVVVHGVIGLRFRAGDDHELETALLSLADLDVRRRMGAAGAARVAEHFTLTHQVDAYREAIETTLRLHGSRGLR